MKNIFILLCAVLVYSCKKQSHEPTVWLNATVSNLADTNCGLPVLNFSEDSILVRTFTGERYSLDFLAKGLPAHLNVQGKKLRILIAKLKAEEAVLCRTFGPDYPALKIVEAVAKE